MEGVAWKELHAREPNPGNQRVIMMLGPKQQQARMVASQASMFAPTSLFSSHQLQFAPSCSWPHANQPLGQHTPLVLHATSPSPNRLAQLWLDPAGAKPSPQQCSLAPSGFQGQLQHLQDIRTPGRQDLLWTFFPKKHMHGP
jgi:hypothetical protein